MKLQVQEDLFKVIMKGDWEKVVEIYRQYPLAHKTKINDLEDTALHLAVSNGPENIVEDLVEIISEKDKKTLERKNKQGNTPLHLAASMGSLRMCICIAEADPALGSYRNNEGESPLFLAALHGKTDTFVCLHSICRSKLDNSYYYRKKGGETILHCAVKREYLDLAYQILHLDKELRALTTSVDEQGMQLLHLLANKPEAFRSGCHLGWWSTIIYHCTHVDVLKVIDPKRLIKICKDEKSHKFPKNYRACIDFFKLLWKVAQVVIIGPKTNNDGKKADEENPKGPNVTLQSKHKGSEVESKAREYFSGYFKIVKSVSMPILIILGYGTREIRKIKETHILSAQIMKMFMDASTPAQYFARGEAPLLTPIRDCSEYSPDEDDNLSSLLFDMELFYNQPPPEVDQTKDNLVNPPLRQQPEEKDTKKEGTKQTPKKPGKTLLIAASNGITEMVKETLERYPMTIHETSEGKNIVHWVVENRQPHIVELLLKSNLLKDSMFQIVDEEGNSVLHLAAMLRKQKHWIIPGAALQMQWEIKWYEFVKTNAPQYLLYETNKQQKTPADIFTETHEKLVKEGGEWLNKTSESCSVVAALIATVAFAASTTIPGGIKDSSGTPILVNQPAFDIFAISSLVALCVSVTALFLFLAILTSRYQEKDFRSSLPKKLLLGLTSLFVSIAAMLVSFCAGHFFVLKDKLKNKALPVYAVTCLPITFYAMSQFPLYFDLLRAFKKVPQPINKVVSL